MKNDLEGLSKSAIFIEFFLKDIELRIKEAGQVSESIDMSASMQVLREVFQDYYALVNPNIILLIDVKEMKANKFAFFLTFLESSVGASVWFYGASLDKYPLTIISRCELFINSSTSWIDTYLKERNLIELSDSMYYLKHYDLDFAVKMIKAKQSFVSFLLGVHSFMYKDYYILTIGEKTQKEFFYLFYEWLNRSEFFLERELDSCPELRGIEFLTKFYSVRDTRFYKYFLPFLISYRVRV